MGRMKMGVIGAGAVGSACPLSSNLLAAISYSFALGGGETLHHANHCRN
jgi:hypothetical protein